MADSVVVFYRELLMSRLYTVFALTQKSESKERSFLRV